MVEPYIAWAWGVLDLLFLARILRVFFWPGGPRKKTGEPILIWGGGTLGDKRLVLIFAVGLIGISILLMAPMILANGPMADIFRALFWGLFGLYGLAESRISVGLFKNGIYIGPYLRRVTLAPWAEIKRYEMHEQSQLARFFSGGDRLHLFVQGDTGNEKRISIRLGQMEPQKKDHILRIIAEKIAQNPPS
jgi:hypothetical protein